MIANIGSSVLTCVFTILLVEWGTGLWGYIFAQVASSLVVLIMLARAAVRLVPRAALSLWTKLRRPPREMFSFALAAFVMDVVGFLYSQTDKVILGFYLDARSVGIYAVAATIVAFLPIALQSVNQIFSPTIADLHARGDFMMLDRLFQILTKWVFALTLPLTAVVVFFSRALMGVFGPAFEAGWIILVIGAVGQLVNCGVGSVGYLLLMSGNERRLVRIQLVMGILTVTCCLLLVPHWGVTGAAVAVALGNAGTNAWSLWEAKRRLGLFPYNRGYSKLVVPLMATLAVGIGFRRVLNPAVESLWIVVAVTVCLYAVFIATVLLLGLDADERVVANAAWSRLSTLFTRSRTGVA